MGRVKPQYCWLCGRDFRSEWFHTGAGGELVRFRDCEPLPDGYVGQPDGLEWFCREHAPAARALAHLDANTALVELRRQFGEFPVPEFSPFHDPALWVTSVGPNPSDVFAVIRRATGVPAEEALNLLRSGEFEVARGSPQQLEEWRVALTGAGARVAIRYD
jgi:hypothetical protein